MSSPTTTEIRVEGMTCNNCARKVTTAAQNVPGVHSVSVNVEAGRASVRWQADTHRNVPAILAAISQAGFAARESSPAEPARRSRWQWNLILGLAVTGGLMTGEWILRLDETPWFRWLAFALAGWVQVYCGARFYSGAWRQLKAGQSNMDTLVALGSTTAFGYSAWALLAGPGGHLYFMEAAAIISFISFGHWLEARVSEHASDALKSLLQLAPPTARRLQPPATPAGTAGKNGAASLKSFNFSQPAEVPPVETEVPVATLQIDDRVVLRPGDRVPVDGVVLEGESAVDETMLTGESVLVDKRPGGKLSAGTVNLNGRLVMRVTAMGEDTALAHIIASVQRAQTSRASIQRLGDRISSIFVPVIVALALAAGLWWTLAPASAGHVHFKLERFLWHAHLSVNQAPGFIIATGFIIAAAVLIIACPCAMGLATPVAIMAAANTAARRGILIRDGVALEKAGTITTIIFDKTGTLTMGRPQVTQVWLCPVGAPRATPIAQILARNSNHPISQAVAAFCDQEASHEPNGISVFNWKEIRGAGVEAQSVVGGRSLITVRLGSPFWLREKGVDLAAGEPFAADWSGRGATMVGLAAGTELLAWFAVRDAVRPNATKVVAKMQRQHLKLCLLTGDQIATATAIARELGIGAGNVFAEVQPERKAEIIKRLQAQGERVAFVGDGINDAPALAQADLGIAVSRASDVAREAADIILLKSEIEAIPEALGLARATLRTIKQNLFWAFFYNALGVPLAALGFISPVFCALAMGCSDLIVIGNSLRLFRWRPRRK